jgi:hypothetical protein
MLDVFVDTARELAETSLFETAGTTDAFADAPIRDRNT